MAVKEFDAKKFFITFYLIISNRKIMITVIKRLLDTN